MAVAMKILHVIPSVSPVRGGPSQAVLEMVQALRHQGVDAEIATTNDDGDQILPVPLNQRIEIETIPVFQSCSVPVRFFNRYSPKQIEIREFTFSCTLTRWLWQHISTYDLLHVHAIFSYPSSAAMAIARWQGVPYINRPLGQLCSWSLQQSRRKKQLYLKLIEQANLQASHALHFTSAQEQQEAQTLQLNAPSFVVPHGLAVHPRLPQARQRLREQLHLPADEPVILFLSRLHPKKGLELLISALGAIRSRRFTLVLGGSGTTEYEADIERQLIAAKIHHRTHRLGFVSGEFKELLLQGSDLFTLPSYSENFGIAVLEALTAGLPVLITPEVALASLVQNHQLGWVIPHDRQAIANAIQHCLDTQPWSQTIGDRARDVVQQQFAWSAIAKNLIYHYEGIIHKASTKSILIPDF
jgi:glycosyltransferase involved in cell wall biosynthesis